MNTSVNIEDHVQLQEYLRDSGRIAKKDHVKVSKLTGGVSNRTVLIEFDNGTAWVMKQALDKLRVEQDWFCSPERIFFEAEAMRWLNTQVPDITPKMIFEDRSEYILAMEAVPPPFENLKTLLLNGPADSSYFRLAGKLLGQIHARGSREPGQLPKIFNDRRFFRQLRIDPYYLETARQVPETGRFFKDLIDTTENDRYTLVHGDYSPKNLLVKNHKLILLDHEVTHFGDGTFDLGFFIAHLYSKAHYLPMYRNEFLLGTNQFYISYKKVVENISGLREERAVRHTMGCFLARVCGLSQLEYLSHDQRKRQQQLALEILSEIPVSIEALTSRIKLLLDA